MTGQPSIKVIEFGPNPLVGPEHPNEVSLSLDDAMEMIEATYGRDVTVEIVQDEKNPECGKILLSLIVVLPQYLKQRNETPTPVMARPEYHALVAQLMLAPYLPSHSLSDELIAERRDESSHE